MKITEQQVWDVLDRHKERADVSDVKVYNNNVYVTLRGGRRFIVRVDQISTGDGSCNPVVFRPQCKIHVSGFSRNWCNALLEISEMFDKPEHPHTSEGQILTEDEQKEFLKIAISLAEAGRDGGPFQVVIDSLYRRVFANTYKREQLSDKERKQA